jgi:MFS family permease
MGIVDTDFNLFFSMRSFPNLIVPFFLAAFIDRYGMKRVLLTLSALCCVGQLFFTLGLTWGSYWMCLLGRCIFGVSDSVTVFQHTILCFWFDATRLPFIFGLLLFFVKGVRALNDNLASIFYNLTLSLPGYFWLGFAICCGSLISSYYLITLHESII